MAKELRTYSTTGQTLYAVVENANGQPLVGTTAEDYVAGDWGSYAIAGMERPGTGCYLANMPAAAAGVYLVTWYTQVGGAPAITDEPLGADYIEWDGARRIARASILARTNLIIPGQGINVKSQMDGDVLTLILGDRISVPIENLGNISDRSRLYLTIKRNRNDADTAALVQVEESAGLLYLKAAVAGTPAYGDITVQDAVAGNITLILEAPASNSLEAADRVYYGIKKVVPGAPVRPTTLQEGWAVLVRGVTGAIS